MKSNLKGSAGFHNSSFQLRNQLNVSGVFLISSSLDKDIKLWTPQGALVGVFGIGMWKLDDPLTWKAQEIKPLEVRMLLAHLLPIHKSRQGLPYVKRLFPP